MNLNSVAISESDLHLARVSNAENQLTTEAIQLPTDEVYVY